MSKNIRFSIVIPVYNRVNILTRCIENVLAQNYPDFEIILVDDNSNDKSGKMCDDYASRYDNISAFHNKKNLGPGPTRNVGIKKATGDYVIFLDCDDKYDYDLLSKVAKGIDGVNPDILVYSLWEEYYNENGDIIYKYPHSLPTSVLNKADDIHEMVMILEEETMLGYPWNKAYNLEYIKKTGAEFPDIAHVEDILFNIAAFENVTSLVILEDQLYHYCNEAHNRLTDKYLPNYFELQKKRIVKLMELQERWNSLNEYGYYVLAGEYFRWLLSAVERRVNQGEDTNTIRAFLAKEYNSRLYIRLRGHLRVSPKLELLYKPMLEKDTKNTVRIARFVSTVKHSLPALFSILKQNR